MADQSNGLQRYGVASRPPTRDAQSTLLQQPSTASSLPPDVAAVRKNRMESEILAYFKRPLPADSAPSPLAKGIGLYTHIEVPQHAPSPRQTTANPEMKLEFLPLGGPQRVRRNSAIKADLPNNVKRVYEQLRAILKEEERAVQSGKDHDPREKYSGLGLPNIMVPPPPSIPTPPGPPPLDDDFLYARRDSVVNAISLSLLSEDKREELKHELDENGWPRKYSSLEAYNSAVAEADGANWTPWSDEDTRALVCIRQTAKLPFDSIAHTFFPERTETSVRNQYAWATKDKDGEDDIEMGEIVDEEPSFKEIGWDTGRRPSWGRTPTWGGVRPGTRRPSSEAVGEDVNMGGTEADATRKASVSSASGNATTGGTTYDPSRDPRRRGR